MLELKLISFSKRAPRYLGMVYKWLLQIQILNYLLENLWRTIYFPLSFWRALYHFVRLGTVCWLAINLISRHSLYLMFGSYCLYILSCSTGVKYCLENCVPLSWPTIGLGQKFQVPLEVQEKYSSVTWELRHLKSPAIQLLFFQQYVQAKANKTSKLHFNKCTNYELCPWGVWLGWTMIIVLQSGCQRDWIVLNLHFPLWSKWRLCKPALSLEHGWLITST